MRSATILKFEITKTQLGDYYFRLLIAFTYLNGHSTLASAGRELVIAGLRSKDRAGLINDKIDQECRIRGIEKEEFLDIVMAERGYDNKYRAALKKHGCKTMEELLDKI